MDFTSSSPTLQWQLSVLSRAIHYKNLSGAADHIGISQPQLSRIVAKLEEELGVILLDRTVKRKSGWLPVATKIAETYLQSSRKLSQALQELADDSHVSQLSIGTLEGLIPLANQLAAELFKLPKLRHIELNVYDLDELEERFSRDELDLVITSREVGRSKRAFSRNLGFQRLTRSNVGSSIIVQSQFDFATTSGSRSRKRDNPKAQKFDENSTLRLVSNSLAVRRHWVEEVGAWGTLPSEVKPKRAEQYDVPVLLLASNVFNPSLWRKIEQFRL